MKHLLVSFVIIEWNDRNSIINLERKAVDTVIDNDDVLEISVFKDPQVLDVVALGCQTAVLAVETVLDVLLVWVDVVKNGISVDLVTSCEDNDLEVLSGFLKALHYERPDVDASIHGVFIWEVYLKYDIRVLCLDVVDAVDQGLVHVENHQFFLCYNKRSG